MVASSAVPFTLDADLDPGAFMEPWSRVSGADVAVRRGGAPTSLPNPEAGGVVRQHAGRRTLLRLPSGVRFLVEDGRAVRYETERGAQALRVTRRHGAVMRTRGYDPREAEC